MDEVRVVSGLLHTSCEPRVGKCLRDSRLSDRQRVGVILQGAALLSHLESARGRLSCPWEDLGLDDQGLLRGAHTEPGRDPLPPQERLTDLVEIVFGGRDRLNGKGQAKRLVSRELRRWHRWYGRLVADRVVTRLLDEAAFLWQPSFAAGRRALIAEMTDSGSDRILVAGRAAFATRLLARGGSRDQLEKLVVQETARESWWWDSDKGLGSAITGPRYADGKRLHFLGQWREAAETLSGLQKPAARILRADCLRLLGRLATAKKLLAAIAAGSVLSPKDKLALAAVETAVHLDGDESDKSLSILAQLELGSSPRQVAEQTLLAAEVAARRRDWQGLHRLLPALNPMQQDAEHSWRWNRLMFWSARARNDSAKVERYGADTLIRGRRHLPKVQRAAVWQELADQRLEAGDYPGARKAARHALRIFEAIDERAAVSSANWLADLELRQGRLLYAEQQLESAQRCASWAAGLGPSSAELRARMEMVLGRPLRALGKLEVSSARGSSCDAEGRERVRVLAARALGWLGRGAEAREMLDQYCLQPRRYLDAEEMPALWALAGDWTRAKGATEAGAPGHLWRLTLANEAIPANEWELLGSLGSFRAARLVFDLQILAPGKVPPRWLEKAIRTLREVGAHAFAERLDRSREGSWRAMERFLNRTSRQSRDIGELFAAAGYFDARLEWRYRGAVETLVPGQGGTRELKAATRGGELVLSASSMDPVVRALFALAAREFEPANDVSARRGSRVQGILGESETLRAALSRLERLADADIPVLIQGETGTGKELAARQLHQLSGRSSAPLVTINCAALSESLLLSDLFGHVRGAFTGAERDRAGVFEAARGGTVLLDEIGDLPLPAQGKLLRVLQEGEVRRVGESLPRRVDIRVVAATHRNLQSMAEQSSFRVDLYYRLKVGSLTLPPLRDRGQDVLVLADEFLRRSGHTLTARARRRLLGHPWPGNVRELRNVLQVAVALSERTAIDLSALELPVSSLRGALGYHQRVEDFRRELVRQALAASDGHRPEAARRLAVSRQALSYLVRRFDLQ